MKIHELFIKEDLSSFHATNLMMSFTAPIELMDKINTLNNGDAAKLQKQLESKTQCGVVLSRGSSFVDVVLAKIKDENLDSLSFYVDIVDTILQQYAKENDMSINLEDDISINLFFGGVFPKLPHKIDYEKYEVYINVSRDDASLAGIHNAIGRCKSIRIENCERISSNVLGVLKIKASLPITFAGSSFDSLPQWVKIVQNHLPSKDILNCQEDLIEAGLKEYARL